MSVPPFIERLQQVHGALWSLWLLSLGLLVFTITSHPTHEVTLLAENFRPSYHLLPIHIIIHRGLANMGTYAFLLSLVLSVPALIRPREGVPWLSAAIGISLLYFAFHTFFYSQMMTEWMRATTPP